MTGVIDRYAVISEHLHYNPSFDVDAESERVARGTSKHGVGYLDVALDPEGRERSDSRMAEETEPTSEIVFQTAGSSGTASTLEDRTDDFNFEPAGSESPGSPKRRGSKSKDEMFDLRTGTGRQCGKSSLCVKIGTVAVLAAAVGIGIAFGLGLV
eukprot:m.436915 g.436915  ORF g.436915 m.436915 type:complete len:155 (+) comp18036_c0_seq1:352-816(+)